MRVRQGTVEGFVCSIDVHEQAKYNEKSTEGFNTGNAMNNYILHYFAAGWRMT